MCTLKTWVAMHLSEAYVPQVYIVNNVQPSSKCWDFSEMRIRNMYLHVGSENGQEYLLES